MKTRLLAPVFALASIAAMPAFADGPGGGGGYTTQEQPTEG